jgi:hypothetical protein
MFAALLDTCVLWPSLQRDFLLSLAVEGAYRPLWSAAILEELEEHVTHNTDDFPTDRLPAGLKVVEPAVFAYQAVALDPAPALSAVEQIAARSGRRGHSWTPAEVLDLLVARYRMDDAVKVILLAIESLPGR